MSATLLPALWLRKPHFDLHSGASPGDAERILRMISQCRTAEGAYSVRPGGPPYSETCQFAVALHNYTTWSGEGDGSVADSFRGCIEYLMQFRSPDGGFSDYLGGPSMPLALYYTASTLWLAGALSELAIDTFIEALRRTRDNRGIPAHPQYGASITNVFWSCVAARAVGEPKDILEGPVDTFIAHCDVGDGSFSGRPGSGVGRLQYTAEAVISASLLGFMEKLNGDQIHRFITRCSDGRGSFGESPGAPATPNDTMLAVAALAAIAAPGPVPRLPLSHFGAPDLWKLHAIVTTRLVAAAAY